MPRLIGIALAAASAVVCQILDGATPPRAEGCWLGDMTFEMCCHSIWGDRGLASCWNDVFSFEGCCYFHAGNGNERHLPALAVEDLFLAPAPHRSGHDPVMHLRQDLSKGSWDDQLSGLLWKQAYAMLRWLEELPDALFRGRRVLELGTGLGLLSLHAALRGAVVTGTDGTERSLAVARANAKLNFGHSTAQSRIKFQLVRWEDVQSEAHLPPLDLAAPYALVICSALLYAPLAAIRHLVRLLWLVTDGSSQILWGSGVVRETDRAQKWALILRCFEVVEEVDAVARGFTVIDNTTVLRLRQRRRRPRRAAATAGVLDMLCA